MWIRTVATTSCGVGVDKSDIDDNVNSVGNDSGNTGTNVHVASATSVDNSSGIGGGAGALHRPVPGIGTDANDSDMCASGIADIGDDTRMSMSSIDTGGGREVQDQKLAMAMGARLIWGDSALHVVALGAVFIFRAGRRIGFRTCSGGGALGPMRPHGSTAERRSKHRRPNSRQSAGSLLSGPKPAGPSSLSQGAPLRRRNAASIAGGGALTDTDLAGGSSTNMVN